MHLVFPEPKMATKIVFFGILFSFAACSKQNNKVVYTEKVKTANEAVTNVVYKVDTIETTMAAIRAMVFQPNTMSQLQLSTVYRTPDNGGGIWKYDSTEINWDNTGLILCTSNSKRFKRIYDQNVNIVWFGAVPNAGDQQVVIQRAINNLPAGKTLWVPDGIFFTTRLYGLSNMAIDGTGTLKADPSDIIGWHILRLEGLSNISIKHITLDGNMAAVAGSHASGVTLLQIWNCNNVTLDSVYFSNNNYLAVAALGTTSLTVKNCAFLITDVGVLTQGSNQSISVCNCYFNGGTSEAVSVWGNPSKDIDKNISVSNNMVVNKTASSAFHLRYADSITITNNSATNCVNGVGTESSNTASRINVTGNQFSNCKFGISGNFNNSVFFNNLITNSSSTGIWLGLSLSSSNNTINSNSITNVNSVGLEEDGIRLMHAVNNTVNGNQVVDNRSTKMMFDGILIKGTDCLNNYVTYNFVSGAAKFYLTTQNGATGTVFQGNTGTISDFGTGTVIYQ